MMIDNDAFFKLFDNERLTKSALTLSAATDKTPLTQNEPSGHQTVEHHAKPTKQGIKTYYERVMKTHWMTIPWPNSFLFEPRYGSDSIAVKSSGY
jgi:hypothetical protein